jgi:hypothetical protein
MKFPKASTKLMSALTIATLFSSSMALAESICNSSPNSALCRFSKPSQTQPQQPQAQPEPQPQPKPLPHLVDDALRVIRNEQQAQQPQPEPQRPEPSHGGGLTPGQIQNDQSSLDRARQAEREARQRQEEQQRQDQFRRQQEEQRRQDEFRRQQEDQRRQDEFRRQQDEQRRRDEDRRRQQDQIRQQQIIDQQIALQQQQAELARQAEEQRQALLRQGSANVVFTAVTRKTGGEWLRVNLMASNKVSIAAKQLSALNISIEDSAAKIHEVIVHTDSGRQFGLNELINSETGESYDLTSSDRNRDVLTIGMTVQSSANTSERVVAIDIRAEAMGKEATLNVTLDSLEGKPTLTKQRFAK